MRSVGCGNSLFPSLCFLSPEGQAVLWVALLVSREDFLTVGYLLWAPSACSFYSPPAPSSAHPGWSRENSLPAPKLLPLSPLPWRLPSAEGEHAWFGECEGGISIPGSCLLLCCLVLHLGISEGAWLCQAQSKSVWLSRCLWSVDHS